MTGRIIGLPAGYEHLKGAQRVSILLQTTEIMASPQADLESQIQEHPQQPPPTEEQTLFPWIPAIAFLFLTFSCGQAVYRARDDPSIVSFIVSAYAALLVLFWCLRRMDRLPPGGAGAGAALEEKLAKFAVWLLAVDLNGMASLLVAKRLPSALAALVWMAAGATALGGFYVFFIHRGPLSGAAGRDQPARPTQEAEMMIYL